MRRTALQEETQVERSIHSLPVPEVFQLLGSRPTGLSQAEALARLQRFGPNTVARVRGRPLALKLLANLTHLMAVLLWIGGFIAFVARLPQLGIAIWTVVVINGVFSFWQEYKAERATEALRRLLPTYARVLRDGEERRVLAESLVPGDVLVLAEGDRVPADGRVVQAVELYVDQSTLTGESSPVRKVMEPTLRAGRTRAEVANLVFSGTSVTSGSAKVVVFATGMNTQFGRIAHLTQSVVEEPSPLQKEMGRVTRVVTMVAVSVGLLFFLLAVSLGGMDLAVGFIFGLGMIVAFVPEGLLPTVSLALAMGVQRMARRNALVKRLSAVETLGSATVICTNKTGTLTQNEMTVQEIWVAGRRLTVMGVGYAPEGQILEGGRPVSRPAEGDLRELLVAAALCNDSRLLPPEGESPRWSALGDPTEAALRVAALKGGVDPEAEGERTPRVLELPFDSRRKRMTTIHRAGAARVAYVKGAPKETLALCSYILHDGQVLPLDEVLRARITAANDDYARSGLRVLAVALRVLPEDLTEHTPQAIERDLTFLGLMAMLDPPRPEVAEAVGKCHRAGIRIVMITGDYGLTAESIARRVGMVRGPRPLLITGTELDSMDDQALREALGHEVILARVAPEHKLRVVTVLKEMGHVVAVTGDGVNDAPSLKRADIGLAMGLTGTDVAKEAADIVLTDDNFASIVMQ